MDTSTRVFSLVRSEASRRRRLQAERTLEVAVRRIRAEDEAAEQAAVRAEAFAQHTDTALAVVEGGELP